VKPPGASAILTAMSNAAAATDRQFFAALLAADAPALDRRLSDDFVLIDVMSGSEISKPALIGVVGQKQLVFEAIDAAEPKVRRYGSVAVVNGTTEMRGHFGADAWAARSRYTHVYVETPTGWQMVSAQGTAMTGEPPIER
jgi:ketosteroid isomerase-like protein